MSKLIFKLILIFSGLLIAPLISVHGEEDTRTRSMKGIFAGASLETNLNGFAQFVVRDNYLSYLLADTKSQFFEEVLNYLRAGKEVRVVHHVSITKNNGFFSSLFGYGAKQQEIIYRASYDLLNNSYYLRRGDNKPQLVSSPDILQRLLLSVTDVELQNIVSNSNSSNNNTKENIKASDSYKVKVNVSFSEDYNSSSWWKVKLAINWLRKELNGEAIYNGS